MQRIRIRDTDVDLSIEDTVYPFVENGLIYLRIVVLNYDGEPSEFLSIMPQDILYRIATYDEKVMKEIRDASDQAHIEQTARMAAAMEEEEDIDDTVVDEFEGMYHG